jgi:hypothetical protein
LEDGTQQVTFVHRKSASGTPHSSAPITRGVTPQPSPIADNVGAAGLSLMPPLDSSSASVNLFQTEKNIRVCQKETSGHLLFHPVEQFTLGTARLCLDGACGKFP